MLFCGHDETDYANFWRKFKTIRPEHPVFQVHASHLGRVVPCYCHADEGTTLKKRAIMILQWQPIMGHGTSRGGAGLNYLGQSTNNRFLFAVMPSKIYMGKVWKRKRLQNLVTAFAESLASCFHRGIDLQHGDEKKEIYLATLSLKGDWPALVRLGGLQRHFLRDTSGDSASAGLCHLCMSGRNGAWHDVSFSHMQQMKRNFEAPWATTPSLVSLIPHSPAHAAEFFRVDLFHTFHKGVVGDAAASCIETRH